MIKTKPIQQSKTQRSYPHELKIKLIGVSLSYMPVLIFTFSSLFITEKYIAMFTDTIGRAVALTSFFLFVLSVSSLIYICRNIGILGLEKAKSPMLIPVSIIILITVSILLGPHFFS